MRLTKQQRAYEAEQSSRLWKNMAQYLNEHYRPSQDLAVNTELPETESQS